MMRVILWSTLFTAITAISCNQKSNTPDNQIIQGKLNYDFQFADLSAQYLESQDSNFLNRIAELDATDHLINHANYFNNEVPKSSNIELINYLLSPVDEKRGVLKDFKQNLSYAKKIASEDLPQNECLKYLPEDFEYSGNLYFTFGYDLGVVFGNNASVNLAHPHYLEYRHEIKYYAIHELHHAGFVQLKNNRMPSLDIKNYNEMAELIEYYTHLEGMATYAALAIRQKEDALDTDADYITLQDSLLMRKYEKEYFDIYFHFKDDPQREINDSDWELISVLSDNKRLWYCVGAFIAQNINDILGRKSLVELISKPSDKFISTYLEIKNRTVHNKK